MPSIRGLGGESRHLVHLHRHVNVLRRTDVACIPWAMACPIKEIGTNDAGGAGGAREWMLQGVVL